MLDIKINKEYHESIQKISTGNKCDNSVDHLLDVRAIHDEGIMKLFQTIAFQVGTLGWVASLTLLTYGLYQKVGGNLVNTTLSEPDTGYNSPTDLLQTAAGSLHYQGATYGVEYVQGSASNESYVLQDAR